MKKAIITGGTGFIGSWLIQELLNHHYDVTAVVRNRSKLLPELKNNSNLTIVEGNMYNLTEKHFAKDNYDLFYHLSWAGVSTDKKNEIDIQLANIKMVLEAIDLCARINCKRFLSTGTVAEYVFCPEVMDVNAKQTPNDMYGAAKVSAHYFLEVRARQLSQPFNWLIIPSTFGERRNDNNIITYTIRSLLNGERPSYGDLNQMWDFLYVGEVVRAIRLIGEIGAVDKVYGIGSGDYHPLREYIETIRNIINPSLELGIGDIPSLSKQSFSSCVNIDDLKRDTGFKPEITFEEGIVRTIQYQKSILGMEDN